MGVLHRHPDAGGVRTVCRGVIVGHLQRADFCRCNISHQGNFYRHRVSAFYGSGYLPVCPHQRWSCQRNTCFAPIIGMAQLVCRMTVALPGDINTRFKVFAILIGEFHRKWLGCAHHCVLRRLNEGQSVGFGKIDVQFHMAVSAIIFSNVAAIACYQRRERGRDLILTAAHNFFHTHRRLAFRVGVRYVL